MEKKLGEIFFEVNERKHPELPVLSIQQGIGTVFRDISERRIAYDKANINAYKVIEPGDFIIHLRSFEGGLECSKHKGISSPAYKILRSNCIDSAAFKDYFRSYNFIEGKLAAAVTGIRDGKNIDMPTFWSLKINIPSLPEQKKIAAFFTLLDRCIQKQRQLVECLKTYKRGVIKQYFSAQKDNTKWTKSTISNCLFYEQPQKYIVHSEHYSNTYETPVLTANKAFILGYTNELDGIYDKGDVLIYDDFTMEVKYVDFPFKVKSSTIKMLTPQSGIDLYFMFTLLKSLDLQPEGHQRSYISILEPMEVNIPCYEEQARASGIFRLLDKQIEKEQQLLHKILDLKSSLLQKMFI